MVLTASFTASSFACLYNFEPGVAKRVPFDGPNSGLNSLPKIERMPLRSEPARIKHALHVEPALTASIAASILAPMPPRPIDKNSFLREKEYYEATTKK